MQEREQLRAVFRRLPFGGGSVMVWGGICDQQWTDLIVIDGNLTAHLYINQVLRPVLVPFLQHQPRLSFQQNARPRKRCQCFAWPTSSPVADRIFVGSSWPANWTSDSLLSV